ncbi:MAG: hypothetical protein JNN04_03180 [Cyclobacteriaceae bacterium]|nr:hypothetical protein [Cyclobacteriaceae bacterium]
MKTVALFFIASVMTLSAYASDSTATTHGTWKATARIHSMGFFSYGGRLVSRNGVADVHVMYDRKTWHLQAFKAIDLNDRHTPVNFAMAVFGRPLHVGKKLTFTPQAGVVLEQFTSLADHGSDAAFLFTTAYRIHPRVTLEHTILVSNLVLEPSLRDCINRLRVLYKSSHLDVTLFAWHNNSVFDDQEYATLGLSVFTSRWKLVGPVTAMAGITGLCMAQTSDERAWKNADGILLTLGFAWN